MNAPARRSGRRLLLAVPLLIFVLLVAVAAGVAWIAGTNSGTRWALRTGAAFAGATIKMDGLRGSLASGLSIDTLEVRHPAADVDANNLRIEVDWRAWWTGHLHFPAVTASRLRIDSRPSDEPSTPLTSLSVPLAVDIDSLRIGALDILTRGVALPVALSGIDLRVSLGEQSHRLLVNNVRAVGPEALASLRGNVVLDAAPPFAATADLDIQGRQAERGFDIHAAGRGSLQALDVTLRGTGAGVGAEVKGQLALLEGFPLRTLQLQLHGVDPAAWVPDAPHANLDLAADLAAAESGAAGVMLTGPFSLANSAPQTVDRGGLPIERLAGQLSLPVQTLETVDVDNLEVVLNGGGRVTGNLAWKAGADSTGTVNGRLAADNVDASKLYGTALATKLSGPISFTADAAVQQVNAALAEKGQAVPVSLKLAARLEKSVLTVSQADLAAGPAKATATGELHLADDRRFTADVRLDKFNPAFWLHSAGLPPAIVSASAKVKGALAPTVAGSAALSIEPGSRWNGAPLAGRVDASFAGDRISNLDAALTAGVDSLQAAGAFGRVGDRLLFDLKAPQLGVLWPTLRGQLNGHGVLADTIASPSLNLTLDGSDIQAPGGVHVGKVKGKVDVGGVPVAAASGARRAASSFSAAAADIDLAIEQLRVTDAPQAVLSKGTVKLSGTVASHHGSVDADFTPTNGSGPATVSAGFDGSWGQGADGKGATGWRGTLSSFNAARDPFGMTLTQPVALQYLPGAAAPAWQWEVGATEIALKLPGGRTGKLIHAGSRGGAQRWETQGRAEGLAWAPDLLLDAVTGTKVPDDHMVVVDADWDVQFQTSLQGKVHIERRGGDLWIPGTPSVPLGLHTVVADVQAVPDGATGRSRVTAKVDIDGTRFGRVQIHGEAGVLAHDGGLGLDPARPAAADADLDMQDISWASLFLGDTMEVGGKISGKAHVAQEAGRWKASGEIDGKELRLVRIDDGVRLLDGTMKATLADDKLVLESLHFPGVVRVTPRDSRVRKWIADQGGNGKLDITANWSFTDTSGHATIVADKFPALQRSDRFVAGSGRVDMDLGPQKMRIAGLFEADTGWIDLGKQAPASLSSDVYVSRSGGPPRSKPLGIAIDVGAKLGNSFYLQGYGLDTGLTGELRVVGIGNDLESSGTIRTRGGRFDAYGQSLTVRRGVMTFQGPIDDPLLDIIALRTGAQVEAGVQISGTARRPRITLVSQPEVSDVEKLSWLLLGRGPDGGGGSADAGLLLSAATSLLGPQGGEPLSRKLGLDEIGVRSGNVGSTRGLLPERTVAGDSTTSTPQLTSQFFIVGKRLSKAVYLSFEQALSGRDGVIQLSYRLTNRLSVVGKGGTLNGLDLLYYVFFDD